MIDFNYTAPELLPFRIQEVLDAPNEPHRIGGVVYVPEGGGECELVYGENDYGDDGWWCQSCGGWFAASFRHTGRNNIIKPCYCQHCGKTVKR